MDHHIWKLCSKDLSLKMQGQSGFTQSDYTRGYAEVLLLLLLGFFCFFFVRFFVFFGPLGFMVLFTKGLRRRFILSFSSPRPGCSFWVFIDSLYG